MGRRPPQPILRAEEPVVVDGALSEAIWSRVEPLEVVHVFGKPGEKAERVQADVRYAYDEHFLYIGYETFDRNIVAVGTGQMQGPDENRREGALCFDEERKADIMEFFISFGDEVFFWEVHHAAGNQLNDIWCTVIPKDRPVRKTTMSRFGHIFCAQEYVKDEGAFTVQRAVRLKPKEDGTPSTLNRSDDVDTGCTGELRLPWAGIGAPNAGFEWELTGEKRADGRPVKERRWNMAGQEVWLLTVVMNGDYGRGYFSTSPTLRGGWFHDQAAEHWPRYVFSETAAAE
jgi:hypothetical protein